MPYSKDEKVTPGDLPYLGNWQKGELSDAIKIKKQLASCCQLRLKQVHVSPDASATEMLELLFPVLADLRAANETHPLCRFDLDYKTLPPFNRALEA